MNNRSSATDSESMRLDKWLWCARFFKSRSIASDAIKAGKIRVNDERPKPSKTISVQDRLSIRKEAFRYDITVLQLPKSRLSASGAAELYIESEESRLAREQLNLQMKSEAALFPRTHGRPTKRDRRDLMKFKQSRNPEK